LKTEKASGMRLRTSDAEEVRNEEVRNEDSEEVRNEDFG
jgi:hypothetical protein